MVSAARYERHFLGQALQCEGHRLCASLESVLAIEKSQFADRHQYQEAHQQGQPEAAQPLRQHPPPKRKPEGERQQVEKPVIMRNYKLSTLAVIRMDGHVYAIAGHARFLNKVARGLISAGQKSRVIDV